MPDTKFKEMVMKMFSKLVSTIKELRVYFNKEIDNVTKKQAEKKHALKGINISLGNGRQNNGNQSEQYSEKRIVKK